MKIIKNLTFKSDLLKITYDCYIPQESNGIVIQIAHGMIEHKGRYEWLCKSFAKKGYIIFINDHRGHGDSFNNKIPLGEMGKNGFEKAVDDMFTLRNIISKEYPSSKVVLLGHSMGSLLARRFLQLYENQLDALILSGTPSPNLFLGFGSFLFRVADKLGIHSSPKIGDILSFNTKFKLFTKNKDMIKGYWSCSDESVVREYLSDIKCQFRFSTNSFANLLSGMKKVFSTYPKKPQNPQLPILFVSGDEDICGDFSKGVQTAYQHIRSQGYENTAIKIYEKIRHEVFNEINKEEIFADTMSWLETQNL
ncbi:alpha/beta hydrolase [Helicobacter sp. 13S00477-4]|uniref:alpha/beta fold hydrolase n=1 Tax=Helicobacter sp. 13S00477-4 TaxID=1905759 RepID=UPI000BA663E4|nr:alpha/beta hydrolase [Helicobacter sp. 13S00477-4]PAF52398.1 hypothetical protein BKH44_02410 [Helicobacter sp. 13S00477-4]